MREYIHEIKTQLQWVANDNGVDAFPLEEKLAYLQARVISPSFPLSPPPPISCALQETRHAYGRTALLLSGGGSLGSFHLGVVKVRWAQYNVSL